MDSTRTILITIFILMQAPQQMYDEDGAILIFSHWTWMTEEEDAAACDAVDAIMQWDLDLYPYEDDYDNISD